MPQKITYTTFKKNMDFYLQEALNGKIFVYPTDTVYGIGAIQTPENSIRIAEIKQRDPKQLMSILVPDFEYLVQSEKVKMEKLNQFKNKTGEEIIRFLKSFFDKYHGVTYIFDYTTSGVRIIKHDIQKFVKKLGKAFITTSLNISGNDTIRDLKDIPKAIEDKVDYIVDDGILSGKASVLIDFVGDKIIER